MVHILHEGHWIPSHNNWIHTCHTNIINSIPIWISLNLKNYCQPCSFCHNKTDLTTAYWVNDCTNSTLVYSIKHLDEENLHAFKYYICSLSFTSHLHIQTWRYNKSIRTYIIKRCMISNFLQINTIDCRTIFNLFFEKLKIVILKTKTRFCFILTNSQH